MQRLTFRNIVHVSTAVIMALITAAGILKLTDLPAFGYSVSTWTIVPVAMRPLVVVLVPVLEVLVGGCWLAGIGRGHMVRLATGFVAIGTGAFALQWLFWEAPSCGCLGAVARYVKGLESAPVVVARNLVLLAVLSLSLGFSRHLDARRVGAGSASEPADAGPLGPISPGRGFSLIELVVVLVVLAVLIAIALPSLRAFRTQGRLTKDLAGMRSHAAVLLSYGADYKDSFPAATRPIPGLQAIRCESVGVEFPALYFSTVDMWHIALADQYYAGAWSSAVFQSTFGPAGHAGRTFFNLTCGVVAAPEFYDPAARVPPPSQLRAVRWSEIVYPSLKVLLLPDVTLEVTPSPQGRYRVALMDGNASNVAQSSAAPDGDYPNGDGNWIDYGVHFPGYNRFQHTLYGVRGRDLRSTQ